MERRTTERGAGIEEQTDGGTEPQTPPTAPESLPKYVREPVEKQGLDRLTDLHGWVEELIEYRKRPVSADEIEAGEDEMIVEVDDDDGSGPGTKVVKKLPCNKPSCTKCPHGPYLYYVKREGGKLNWEDYRGRV